MRYVLIVVSIVGLFLALGFYFQWSPLVDNFWPWDSSGSASASSSGYYGYSTSGSGSSGNLPSLSLYFIASILAAISLPNLWIGLTREFAALIPGAINLGISFTGIAIYMLLDYADHTHTRVLVGGLLSLALIGTSVAIFIWARRFPIKDQRPTPTPIRRAFGFFVIALLIAGGALVLKRPNIFPWPLSAEMSVTYGWIFLGAAAYFLYGILVPRWYNACGQLLGFLAYDVVLILPFLDHFDAVRSEHRLSLIIYTAVVILSGLLAIYYLFIYPPTRLWRSAPVAALGAA